MLQRSIDLAAIEAEIERVRSLSGNALRRRWQAVFGRSVPEHRYCAFGSATVEAPTGCAVTSNRLASITMFASMLNTDTRNGASRRVPATGASDISISRPPERYLTSGVDARWPAIGS
jgi:hypothetical protein